MNQSANSSTTKHRKHAIATAIACGFLLVLPSCIPHLRHPDPGPPLPERFDLRQVKSGPDLPEVFDKATTLDNSAQLRIEEFFDDPLLTTMIHQALAGNQELRILGEEMQIASNEILARQGAYLPFVNLGAAAGLNKWSNYTLEGAAIRDDVFLPHKFFPNPLPTYALGPAFLWTPDIWWQLHNAKDAAAQRYFASGEARKYLVTRLVAEIAENYYSLMALDARLDNLNRIIELQERSLEIAKARKEAARGSDLPVQRFQAEVRKNQSEKLVVNQNIIQAENRINFVLGRFPQPVERRRVKFIDLNLHALSLGVPPQLLQNRPDIRQAERELAATGLDVKVARKRFYPQGLITSGVGYEAFSPRYLFITPEALVANVAGNLVTPFINRKAIKADYFTANARQLQAVYNYQRVVINGFTDVVNRAAKVENYGRSIEIKKQQVQSLETAVADATSLYQLPRAELPVDYLDVLTAQNELFVAIRDLIEIKGEQLSAVVNAYQALGGGAYLVPILNPKPLQDDHHWGRHGLAHIHQQLHGMSHSGPSEASAAVATNPGSLPTPPSQMSPNPPSAPAAGTDLQPVPGSGAEKGPEPLPTPPAAGERAPFPVPDPPPAQRFPEPLPGPGSGRAPGAVSNTDNPSR
jgi:outer membrane protein TolC